MGQAVAAMDLPCDWAEVLHICAERGLEDNALIVIAMWHREASPMTQQYFINHGHPDGDVMADLLDFHWYCGIREYYGHYFVNRNDAKKQEQWSCKGAGLLHHIMQISGPLVDPLVTPLPTPPLFPLPAVLLAPALLGRGEHWQLHHLEWSWEKCVVGTDKRSGKSVLIGSDTFTTASPTFPPLRASHWRHAILYDLKERNTYHPVENYYLKYSWEYFMQKNYA